MTELARELAYVCDVMEEDPNYIADLYLTTHGGEVTSLEAASYGFTDVGTFIQALTDWTNQAA